MPGIVKMDRAKQELLQASLIDLTGTAGCILAIGHRYTNSAHNCKALNMCWCTIKKLLTHWCTNSVYCMQRYCRLWLLTEVVFCCRWTTWSWHRSPMLRRLLLLFMGLQRRLGKPFSLRFVYRVNSQCVTWMVELLNGYHMRYGRQCFQSYDRVMG